MNSAGAADPSLVSPTFADPNRPPERELRKAIAGDFTLAAVGDCIISRPISQAIERDGAFGAIVSLLREADVCCGNLETSIFEPDGFPGHPYSWDGDWPLASVPAVAEDLARLGFQLMARANNHALDWGIEGMRETTRRLRAAGIVGAGVGETLGAARSPRFHESAKGRIGLVSIATTYRPTTNALDVCGPVPGRPGISSLRLHQIDPVTPQDMEALRRLQPLAGSTARPREDGEQLRLFGRTFAVSEHAHYVHEMDEDDLGDILRNIRQGKQSSDFLVVMLHSHEILAEGYPEQPAGFLKELARLAIDAGANAFVTSGLHHLGPIDIYRGWPIFYGLGNFIWSDIQEQMSSEMFHLSRDLLRKAFQHPERATAADLNALLNAQTFANELAFETVVPISRFHDGALQEIVLHPVELGYGQPLTQSGIPRLASGEQARRTLERLEISCRAFGCAVEIEIEGDAGRIRCA
jgi:poly-gamma-glutamate capsule biosynthesis protein CapA/YwtB (metallophosphatase superfamily)